MPLNLFGLYYPTADQANDVPADMKALVDGLGHFTVMRFANAAARDVVLTAPAAGDLAFLQDVRIYTFYDGTEWLPAGPHAEAAGSVSVTVTAASSGATAVTFPTGRFSVTPLVTISLVDPATGSARLVPRVTSPTSTGFTATVLTGDNSITTSTVTLHWHAKQMLFAAAAG